MLHSLGMTQEALLRSLLKQPDGMTIDELADVLGISRTAVRQHLTALERDGYLARADFRPTKGRPGQTYCLSDAGRALFPKRYSWFSGLLLERVRKERGAEGLEAWLADIAGQLAPALEGLVKAPDLPGRTSEAATVLADLGYEAKATTSDGSPLIVATNCPYHDLAVNFPEVCAFDLRLLEILVKPGLSHEACMARGATTCRFRFHSGH